MSSSKIAVYSLSDLKNTTDDALPNYLASLKFEQANVLTDVRLGVGYAAVVISAVTFYFDHKFGWESTKDYTFWAVILYFVLNSTLTVWIWRVERGTIYTGSRDEARISITSNVIKYSPYYRLKLRYSDTSTASGREWQKREIEASFTKWFTTEGQFIAKPFQEWLTSEVPLVAKAQADQKKQLAKN